MAARQWAHLHKKKRKSVTSLKGEEFLIFAFHHNLVIPGIMAVISTFWFGIGGFIDLFRLFRDLKAREENHLDNGQVDGHVSIADKARFKKLEHKEPESGSANSPNGK